MLHGVHLNAISCLLIRDQSDCEFSYQKVKMFLWMIQYRNIVLWIAVSYIVAILISLFTNSHVISHFQFSVLKLLLNSSFHWSMLQNFPTA